VVNRTLGTARRRERNRGNPTRRPARLPERDSEKLRNARARPSRPVLNASLLHSAHHDATPVLAWFQARRSAGRFHPSAGVSSSSAIP